MSRNVTFVLLLAGLFLATCSTALAQKDPGNAKRLPNTNPEAPKASEVLNSALPEQPPQFSKTVSPEQQAVVSGTFSHAPMACDTYSYWDGTPYWFWTIPDTYGDDFFNMRFTAPPGVSAGLAQVYLGFYDAASSVVSPDGVDIIVWDDDGFGFPGDELARINVPASEMAWYPSSVVVDFTPFDLSFSDEDFHVGFTTVNQTDDVYAILSDEGTTGTERSSEFFSGMWGTMYNDWQLDVNFVIEAELCVGDPGPCLWHRHGTFAAANYFTIPDFYGDEFFNERFTNNLAWPQTLDSAGINLYQNGSIDVTGEGIDLMIWWDDGYGFPGALAQTVNVPSADISWYPEETKVNLTPYSIVIPAYTDFHIGYTTVNQSAGNVMAVLSDDGSGVPEYRSSEYWNGNWGLMINDWGIDYDFLIEALLCQEDTPQPECNYILEYNGDGYYYWETPNSFNDAYYNMRFTMPNECCYISEMGMSFYQGGSIGSPGVDYILLNTDGIYPTDTIAVYSIPEVTHWYAAYETINVEADQIEIVDEFHLAYNPILYTPIEVLAIVSDDGSTATGRGGLWDGNWYTMFEEWSIDAAFFMTVRVCCVEDCGPPYPGVLEDDWSTFSHDYARTGNSPIRIGSLCGFQKIWDYWSPHDYCYFANPTIADELVYASFGVHVECFTVEGDGSGGPVSVWSTTTADPAYATVLGGAIRSSSTIEDSVIYFGAGTLEGFIAADAYTGVPIWIRSPLPPYSNPLEGVPGATRFSPTVIIGDFLYFGSDGGAIYKLNKYTGVTDVWRYTPHGAPIWNSPSSDGIDLYIGCSESLAGGDAGSGSAVGAIYKLRASDLELHPDWIYGGFSGLLGWNEGTTAGATYSESRNWLFTNLALADHTGFDSYAMIIDAADGSPVTANYWLSGQPFYATSTISDVAGLWYFGAVPNKDSRFSGIWCRDYDNNSVWQDFTLGAMTNPAALTCDPYVFWGTRVHPYGTFNCSDARWGERLFTYELTGYGFGAAIAKYNDVPYVAHTQLWSDCGTGGGRLTMYSTGDSRPRLSISSNATVDPPLSFDEPSGTQRAVEEIFCNSGCSSLEYCLSLEADPDYPAGVYIMTGDPNRMDKASRAAQDMVQFSIDDFNAMEGWKEARMRNRAVLRSEYGDRVMEARQSDFSLSGPPSWVTLVSPATGALNQNSCYDAVFEFDVPSMSRGSNIFYLVIATNDPDYNECQSALPLCNGLEVNSLIEIDAIVGFAFCDFYLDFGFGGDDWEYANNGGWFDNGEGDDNFIVDGMEDPLYMGSFWWGLRTNRLAWLEEGGRGFNHLFSDDVCTSDEEILLGQFCDGTQIYGDYFEAAVIDSIYDYDTEELADSLTIGMRMVYREYGAYAESASDYFNNFKLIAYDFSNRNSAPVDSLYWGLFADWDMPGDAAGYEQAYGDLTASALWQYNEVSGEVAGYGVLPMSGSALFPSGALTHGIYNGYVTFNPSEVYPPNELPRNFMDLVKATGPYQIGYHPASDPGSPPDDRSIIVTAGMQDFTGNETVQGAFVVFAFPTGATVGEITDMMRFANKWAGYGRGDINNDGLIDLLDMTRLARYVFSTGEDCGPPCPFIYLGDINCDNAVDPADVVYMYNFMFDGGPPPMSKLIR